MNRSRWSGRTPVRMQRCAHSRHHPWAQRSARTVIAAAVWLIAAACSDSTGPAAGPPAAVELLAGADQTSTVGTTLPLPIVVSVKDAEGRAVKSAVVTWSVQQGGGTVAAAARTDRDGKLQATWTLGSVAGPQRVTARSDAAQLEIEAVATPGAPASLVARSGTTQSAATATVVEILPAVIVRDGFGNAVPGVLVTCAVTAGGGTVTGGVLTTDADGAATVGSWTLGTAVGVNTLSCSAAGLAPAVFTATAIAGPPAAAIAHAGDEQTAIVAATVPVRPALRVSDVHGNGVPGQPIVCEVTAGGGSVTGATPVSDDAGVATIGGWTLGTKAGSNTLNCSVAGLTPVIFTAIGAAAAPTVLLVHAGDGQTAAPGSDVATPPAVIAYDPYENPVPDALVTFQITAGGGSVSGAAPLTDADGIAVVGSWRLGTTLGVNTLRASVNGASVSFSADAIREDGFTLSVEGVHLNQGNQTAAGTVGGVAGRPGLLRVIVRASETNTYAPAVRVRIYDGAALVREALIPAAQAGVPVSTDLNSIGHTWNLALTGAEVTDGLSVEAVVDPDNVITSAASAKRYPRGSGSATLDIEPLHPLRVVFFPIRATVQNRTGAITQANAMSYLESVRQWIPGSSIESTIRAPYSTDLDLAVRDNWQRLLSEIQAMRTLEGAVDEYYHGIIGHFPGIPYGGLAYRPSQPGSTFRSGLSYDALPHAAATIAHEIGHNMGRMHNACGDPTGIDTNYPHPDSELGAPGYDVLNRVLKHSSQHRDYMSYCGPRWTSDYTFAGLLQWRRADPYARPSASLAAIAAAPQPGLFVWGSVGPDGVTLNPTFALEARPVLPATGGPNVLRGVAGDGREVFRLSFDGVAIEDGDSADRHFAFFVPVAASQAEVVRLELVTPHGNAVRESPRATQPYPIAALRAPPSITLDAAADGDVRVRWDARTYPVALVRDALTGHVLAFVRGGDANIAAPGLPVSRLDVIVSDGVISERRQP